MVHFITPYRRDKNLGKAYNDAIGLIPDGDSACVRDIDTLFLTPEQPAIIEDYANQYPNSVLVCYVSRVSQLSRQQLLFETVSEDPDIRNHIRLAEMQQEKHRVTKSVHEIQRDISGTLMVIPKWVCVRFPFPEDGKCLGVDTKWNRIIRADGIKILRMNAIYIWHSYRIATGVQNKTHLV